MNLESTNRYMGRELDILVNKLKIISTETGEKIESMIDVFSGEQIEKSEISSTENLLANLLGSNTSDCFNETKLLVEVLMVLGCRINHLNSILVDIMGMPDNDLSFYNFPLSIVSADDGDDIVYRLTTSPIDLHTVGVFVQYKYNIPLIIHTQTGVSFSCVITPNNTPQNSKNIKNIKDCLRFVSNNINEICQMLLGYINN